MMCDIKKIEELLKDVYLKIIKNQLNLYTNPFLTKVKRSTNGVYGNEIIISKMLSEVKYITLKDKIKSIYGKITISEKAMRSCQNNAGALVNLINSEIEEMLKETKFNLSRQIMGNGNGILFNIIKQEGNKIWIDTTKNITEYSLVMLASDKNQSNKTSIIQSIDRINNIITLENYYNDANYEYGKVINTDNEITGLKAIFDNDNLYGIKKEEYQFMQPIKIKRLLNSDIELAINLAIDQIMSDLQNECIDFILCSRKLKIQLETQLLKKYNDIKTISLDNGSEAISVNGIPVVENIFMKDNEIYLLNTNDFDFKELCDWKWIENNKEQMLMQTKDGFYEAILAKFGNLICKNPHNQAKIIFE